MLHTDPVHVPTKPYDLGHDFHTSVDGFELVMKAKHQGPTRKSKFGVLVIGPDGEARRKQSGQKEPGPFGSLIALPSVISLHKVGPAPQTVEVEAGDRVEINGLVFEIRDDLPLRDPHLVPVAG